MNGVGYNTTVKSETDNWQFVGAAFQNVGEGTFIPLNAIDCVEGFEEGDQFQTSYLDDKGLVHFVSYDYWDGTGWVDGEGEEIGDSVGFTLGKGAWFISSIPKQLTVAGEVRKDNFIHTFEENWTICLSAYPTAFCPNSADVSWGCQDGDQIQVSYNDDKGLVHFISYDYWEGIGWVDSNGEELAPDFAIVTPGRGFWFITTKPAEVSFTEVSPLAE